LMFEKSGCFGYNTKSYRNLSNKQDDLPLERRSGFFGYKCFEAAILYDNRRKTQLRYF
jgi:hypothetical protein